MQEPTRAMMRKVFDKLNEEQFDDIESQFENMGVLYEQIQKRYVEGRHTHIPAIELHVGELAKDLIDLIVEVLMEPGPFEDKVGEIHSVLWDNIQGAILFGKLIGETGWAVREVPCEEVHHIDH